MDEPNESLENALIELLGAGYRLVRQRRAASNTLELTWSQTVVMGRLDVEGPATTADLARAEAVKPQSMGGTLAALESVGFVERRPHPTDGRQVLFALTTEGQAVRRAAGAIKDDWIRRAAATLTDDDARVMQAATAILRRIGEP